MIRELHVDDMNEWLPTLRAGEQIALSGVVYTARDAVHKKWMKSLECGEELPIDLKGAVIYYTGPTPAPHGRVIGSCGPTTSSRMDVFYPSLAAHGLRLTIGKGNRSTIVTEAIIKYGGAYLCAIGGTGALYASTVTACETVAYEELGCESLKKLTLLRMPLFVGIDAQGNTIFPTL
ncbi:MAG: fumarate hydratase C-terminal domain-containing protein [Clostridia bacterium]|nr:fumarate hydratase C-terminal domain-containing protein [Clostridia bacterium]